MSEKKETQDQQMADAASKKAQDGKDKKGGKDAKKDPHAPQEEELVSDCSLY